MTAVFQFSRWDQGGRRHRYRGGTGGWKAGDQRRWWDDEMLTEGRSPDHLRPGKSSSPKREGKAAFAYSYSWQRIVKIMGLCFKGFFLCFWSIKCSLDQYKCNFAAGSHLEPAVEKSPPSTLAGEHRTSPVLRWLWAALGDSKDKQMRLPANKLGLRTGVSVPARVCSSRLSVETIWLS